jgi:hypothetical protein
VFEDRINYLWWLNNTCGSLEGWEGLPEAGFRKLYLALQISSLGVGVFFHQQTQAAHLSRGI